MCSIYRHQLRTPPPPRPATHTHRGKRIDYRWGRSVLEREREVMRWDLRGQSMNWGKGKLLTKRIPVTDSGAIVRMPVPRHLFLQVK